MLNAQVVIVPAESSNGICDIGPSGGHRVHQASDYRMAYRWIASLVVSFPLVNLHRHSNGKWSGQVHSKRRHDHPNVAVLMDVDCAMLLIAFDGHAKLEGDTPDMMNPKPHLHLFRDLPNHAFVSNEMEIIDIQNNCGDNCALILNHEQSSVNI